jgi:hypothetical protein
MKPQGRQIQKHHAKWKVKEEGKHIEAWWENIIPPSNKRARKEAISEIREEIESYGY